MKRTRGGDLMDHWGPRSPSGAWVQVSFVGAHRKGVAGHEEELLFTKSGTAWQDSDDRGGIGMKRSPKRPAIRFMKATLLAALVAATLLVGSGVAFADPQTVTITATCSGGEIVTVTTVVNNSAGVAFEYGWAPGGSTSVAIVESETSSTVGTLRVAPPGFDVNGLATTTCTFTPSFAPQLGTITAEILFTPVSSG